MDLKSFGIALVIFLITDAIWLSVVANRWYKQQMGALLREKPNFVVAAVFYTVFLIGLVVFVIHPATNDGGWGRALWQGGLYGLVTYATYDLTNLSVLKGWPLRLAIVDMIWGTVLAATVATITTVLA